MKSCKWTRFALPGQNPTYLKWHFVFSDAFSDVMEIPPSNKNWRKQQKTNSLKIWTIASCLHHFKYLEIMFNLDGWCFEWYYCLPLILKDAVSIQNKDIMRCSLVIYLEISTIKEFFLLHFRLKAQRMWILNMPDLENYTLIYLDTQVIYFCKKNFTRLLLMSEPVAQTYVYWEDISLREGSFQHAKWIKIIRHALRPLWNLIYNIRRVYFFMYPSSKYCIF